jgi:hypothetical protein
MGAAALQIPVNLPKFETSGACSNAEEMSGEKGNIRQTAFGQKPERCVDMLDQPRAAHVGRCG